jgi:CDP-diacylglycerol--glycerol-3-phosphate 3-phosphatidyltransferase
VEHPQRAHDGAGGDDPRGALVRQLGHPRDAVIAAWLYGATAVTDLLDGYLARKRNLVSVFGKFMDPLADKLLVMALLIYLTRMGRIAPWIVVVLLGREISVTGLRSHRLQRGRGHRRGRERQVEDRPPDGGHPVPGAALPLPRDAGLAAPGRPQPRGSVAVLLSLVFSVTSAVEYLWLFIAAVDAKERGKH